VLCWAVLQIEKRLNDYVESQIKRESDKK